MKPTINRFLNVKHSLKFKKIKYPILAFTFCFLLISVFVLTKKTYTPASELAFTEHSVLGEGAGSVIPASCNSSPPTSHFGGDCPPPSVSASMSPGYVIREQPYSGFSWSSSGAIGCTVHLSNAGGNTDYDAPPSGSVPSRALYSNTTFYVTCFNAVGTPVNSVAHTVIVSRVALGFGGTPAPTPAPTPMGNLSFYEENGDYVIYGTNGVLHWSISGASSCTAGGSWSGSKSTSGSYVIPAYSGNLNTTRTYTLTCTNGYSSSGGTSVVTFEGRTSSCFTAGTKILMADGTEKNIEDVTIDDTLMTSGGPQEVMKRYVIPYQGKLYAFNGNGNYFVSPTHPFMTTEGWKSINPEGTRRESPGLDVSKLNIGDTLILKNGKTLTLTAIDAKFTKTTVYNFGINGTHDYYADGYLVHNVDMKYLPVKTVHAVEAKN